MDGCRVEWGERILAAVELLQLDPMGFLDYKAGRRVERAYAFDLGQGPPILLENLDMGLVALQDALDGIDELLLLFVFS